MKAAYYAAKYIDNYSQSHGYRSTYTWLASILGSAAAGVILTALVTGGIKAVVSYLWINSTLLLSFLGVIGWAAGFIAGAF